MDPTLTQLLLITAVVPKTPTKHQARSGGSKLRCVLIILRRSPGSRLGLRQTSPNAPLHCLCFTESCDGRGPFMVPQVSAAPRKMTVQRCTFMMIYFSQSLLSNGNSFAEFPTLRGGRNAGCGRRLRARIEGDRRAFAGIVEESRVQEMGSRSTESWLMLMITAKILILPLCVGNTYCITTGNA